MSERKGDSAAQSVARRIADYLTFIADQHSRRTARQRSRLHARAEDMTVFVIRRCVDDIVNTYDLDSSTADVHAQPFPADVTASNHTFRVGARR